MISFLLHKPTQSAAEKELAPLQGLLFIFWDRQGLAAAKLASHGAAIVIPVGILKVTACTEQRPVELQHGTARPAAHQGSHMDRWGDTLTPGREKQKVDDYNTDATLRKLLCLKVQPPTVTHAAA